MELLFDLVFVVAVSLSAQTLHHMAAEGHLIEGLLSFALVFFGLWWAWMNFTWFATAFDTDDWPYRVLTLLQMTGVLVYAAGAPAAMEERDFTVGVIGYVIMRLALVTQWLRAARANPTHRPTTGAYAAGVFTVQLLWILWLLVPEGLLVPGFVLLVGAELLVPVLAERRHGTPWHPHHVAEGYGLFTIIVLGETILASTNAVVEGLQEGSHLAELLALSVAGIVVVGGMWWLYFSREAGPLLTSLGAGLRWGYLHYSVFGAAAMVSVGIELGVDRIVGEPEIGALAARAMITVPVAVFVLMTWALVLRPGSGPGVRGLLPVGGLAIVLCALLPGSASVAGVALVLVVLVAAIVQRADRVEAAAT